MGLWVAVARVEELPAGSSRIVRAGERILAVVNEDGTLYAIDDTCPHQGASLGEGIVHRGRVICPWHSWMFELGTGRCAGVEGIGVGTYPVRRSGDTIEVEVPET